MPERLRGVVTPLLTPYGDDLSIAMDLYLSHAADSLAAGSHYLSPFGTTGEATSNTMSERMAVLEALVTSGTARPDQLMPGTGLCAWGDTLELTRHARGLGCTAAMVLPPFFYPPSDEGLYRYYSSLIEAMGADPIPLILYNIPQNSGVPLSPSLAARLNVAFPEIVIAYKDSSGDWDNTEAVIKAAPGISVFPGSETLMERAMPLGAGGCISASCNSNLTSIRAMFDAIEAGDEAAKAPLRGQLDGHRAALQKAGLIGGLKSLKAEMTGDLRWLNTRPPLMQADPGAAPALAQSLQA